VGAVTSPTLDDLLVAHRLRLVGFLRERARGLLAWESLDDLVQGVHLRAIEGQSGFEYRSEPEFVGWLFTLAQRHVADRHDYWTALKRRSGSVLRFTLSQGVGGTPLPAGSTAGPGTFASRRELLELATRSLAALPERDRRLVEWMSEQVPLEDQAARLGISYAAVQRAGVRAQERFRKTFELVRRAGRRH